MGLLPFSTLQNIFLVQQRENSELSLKMSMSALSYHLWNLIGGRCQGNKSFVTQKRKKLKWFKIHNVKKKIAKFKCREVPHPRDGGIPVPQYQEPFNEYTTYRNILFYYQAHLTTCLFKLVSCKNKNCRQHVQRKDLKEHVSTTCQWRIIKCQHCSELHPKGQMEVQIIGIGNRTTF